MRLRLLPVPLLALVLLAACTGGDGSTTATPTGAASADTAEVPFSALTPAATTPIPGLKWALPSGEPGSLDPITPFNSSTNIPTANMCEPLLRQQPDGSIVPGLAEKVEIPDPLTYVFTLRDATFWDGSAVTAGDVVASMDRAKDPELGSGYAGDFAAVASYEATDPATVTVKLKEPDALFEARMTTGAGTVLAKDFIEQAGTSLGTPDGGLMCTGPYKLGEWKKGDSLTLEANPQWWGLAEAKPFSPTVKFVFITDPAALTAALVAGDVDGAFDLPKVSVDRLATGGAGKAYVGPAGLINEYSVARFDGGLANVKLRQALAKSLDYAGINKALFGSTASPARTLVSPSLWGQGEARAVYQSAYDALPQPTQDLEAAKALVAESGVVDPAIVIAAAQGYPDNVTAANAAQQAAQSVGIKAEVKELPIDQFGALYAPDPKGREGIDLFFLTDISVLPDPAGFYSYITLPGAAGNWAGWDNPEAIALMQQATQELDPVKRADLTTQAERIVLEELPFIPISYQDAAVYLKEGITGVQAGQPSNFFWPWAAYVGGK